MSKTKELFWTFFKIGAFTFGGGYAMVALLQNEFVEEKKWVTKEEFLDMVAIAESTPGPVAVNSVTYIGYKIEGAAGAAASTVAVCLPSFAVIYLISLFFDQFLRLSVMLQLTMQLYCLLVLRNKQLMQLLKKQYVQVNTSSTTVGWVELLLTGELFKNVSLV